MNGLCWLSADQLQQAYASGKLSPSDYLEVLLQHIDTYDPKLNVFLNINRDMLRRQAHIATEEFKTGAVRSPIHGIPVAVKDNIDVLDIPTTCHSRILLDNVAKKDAAVIGRLRQAGAIVLGKVATWEFAIGGPSSDLPFPPANNPWKKGYQPGGSSSGSGAGLAGGLFPLALGSDTAGSIRHPAASCGVVGLKPTYDLVSRKGVFPLSHTLDHVGPMARSVKDVAMLLDAISEYSPCRAHGHPGGFYCSDIDKGIKGLRIGYIRNFHEEDISADPEVASALEFAATILQECGAMVSDIELPSLHEFAAVNRVILHSEAWAIHRKTLGARPQDYGQMSRRRIISGAFFSAGEYVTAQSGRVRLAAAVNARLQYFDVLLSANSMSPAGLLDEFSTGSPINTRQARTPFNVTGHPAISLMSGLSKDGLPLSLQMIGRKFDEKTLLRVAAAYEAATEHHRLHPPISELWN